MNERILVVDDDELILAMLDKGLTRVGYEVSTAADPIQALQLLDENSYDLVITDVNLPKLSGIKVLEMVKALDETIEVVILTGIEAERLETAIAALRLGAHDFLLKPLKSVDDLLLAVDRALEKRRLSLNLKTLSQSLERLSTVDSLTGLATRRTFFQKLSTELVRTKRYFKPISCLLIDVDHFLVLSQNYSMQCGDYVVSEIGRILRGNTRATDLLGRYGGGEFIVALPEIEVETAMRTADKIRKVIETHEFLCGGERIPVTVSVGVSGTSHFTSISDLTARAASALERAKQDGRNCVRAEATAPATT